MNNFADFFKELGNINETFKDGVLRDIDERSPITPQVNELWKHGSEYCFCYTGPRGELRLIYGDGATVPVKDYVIDGNAGYYRVWGGCEK